MEKLKFICQEIGCSGINLDCPGNSECEIIKKLTLESHGINEHYQKTKSELENLQIAKIENDITEHHKETMLASEKVLGKEWDRPEENKAWKDL
jgi:hypothetical protein